VVADAKRLRRTLEELIENQPDDQRLRDHLEGVVRDEQFAGLTWFWGPLLYERNRAVFRGMILNHFSDWEQTRRGWKRIKWSDHADRLQAWLEAARNNRDTHLVRRLLRWKHAAKNWGIDAKAWNAALLDYYRSSETPAARAIVLDEYDDWFNMDEDTALALYQCDHGCSDFILKHLPQTFWGGDKRKLWERLSRASQEAGDEKLHLELYRRQVPIKQWQTDVLRLAGEIQNAEQLCDELSRRHPVGYGLKLGDALVKLLEARGRDVMPYVRSKLKDVVGGWYGDNAKPFVKIAEQRGWWDLWAATIRADRNDKRFNAAVARLIHEEEQLSEGDRLGRLQALAGVSREWNWSGFGFVQVHGLKDEIAEPLYRRYPDLIHGAYKPNVTPTWWQGYPRLLAAAQEADDEELVDLLASRYATQVRYEHAYYAKKEQDRIMRTADSLGDHYQAIRDRDTAEFARRAANVLTRIPAYAIHSYDQLLKSNKLARLLFVRSFEAYLAVPAATRDLVEGSEVHVQMLAYRVLSQNDDRARQMAVETLDILIGTLLRPLHRKTRMAAFGALLNAALTDTNAAAFVLQRAREATRLPDKKYPKEQLIGLIGQILHACPELRGKSEHPVVYGLEEVVA
jgi:hypothetical protein